MSKKLPDIELLFQKILIRLTSPIPAASCLAGYQASFLPRNFVPALKARFLFVALDFRGNFRKDKALVAKVQFESGVRERLSIS